MSKADVWVVARDPEVLLAPPHPRSAAALLEVVLRAGGWTRDAIHIVSPAALPKHATLLIVLDYWSGKQWRGGDEVSQALLGAAAPTTKAGRPEGIQNIRGYLWDTPRGRALTTIHPAAVLRDWTPWRALLEQDIKKARREWDLGCPPLDQRTVTIITTPREVGELRDAIKNMGRGAGGGARGNVGTGETAAAPHDARSQRGVGMHLRGTVAAGSRADVSSAPTGLVRRDAPLLSVDIENTHDLMLACVGFAPTPSHAWVMPAHEQWHRDVIRDLCGSAVPKVLQNGQYDRLFAQLHGGFTIAAQAFDTMLAWHALNPELAGSKMRVGARKKGYHRRTAKSLKFLASIYTRDAWWKDYAFSSEEERYRLCGVDCCTTLDIAQKQMQQLERT